MIVSFDCTKMKNVYLKASLKGQTGKLYSMSEHLQYSGKKRLVSKTYLELIRIKI